MQVQSLGQEDPLEKGIATHSGILAWRIPWTEESGSPQGRKEMDMIETLSVHTHGELLTTAHDLGLLPGSSVKLDILKLYGFLSSFSFFLSLCVCVCVCVYYLFSPSLPFLELGPCPRVKVQMPALR